MNARTGELAADVAWSRPGSIPVALILGYNGAARASLDEIHAWGKPFLMGFESDVTRSYAGGDAGAADSAYSCSRFDEVGYPRSAGSWVCAADASSTGAQFVPNITEYGRRYALGQIAGGRSGPITAYGNPTAVEALCAGIRAAGLVARRWGVGTWGYGEGGGANQPPTQADVEILQSGNTPGPAEGTDLNWLYAPVAHFAALGGPATPSTAGEPPKGDEMIAVIESDGFFTKKGQYWLITPGVYTAEVGAGQTLEQVVHNWGNLPREPLPGPFVDGLIAQVLATDKRNKALDAFLATGGGGSTGGGGITPDAVQAIVRGELDKTKLGV